MSQVQNTFIVDNDFVGVRLDKMISSLYVDISMSLAQKLIRTGQIRVNSKRSKFNTILQDNDSIRVPPYIVNKLNSKSGAYKSNVSHKLIDNLKNSIIYKDKDCLIINKPANINTQGGFNVINHIDACLPYLKFELEQSPMLVHRLDKETSGVLVLARNRRFARYFFALLKERNVYKKYHCIIQNNHSINKHGKIDAPLTKSIMNHEIRVKVDYKFGKEAISYYKVLGSNKQYTLLEFKLITGRSHQIRVHASHILNSPIVGDVKYGGLASNRLYLHAKEIKFKSMNNKIIHVFADYRDEWNIKVI